MKLYSYIVTHDTGFSPNPFFGYCTLACCKPAIRRMAKEGDWVVGLTPKAGGNHIVYFMHVDEVIEFDNYWKDARFRLKRPRKDPSFFALWRGDNAYEPKGGGVYRQLPCMHSDEKCWERENTENKKHDLSGINVLISEKFAYFGSDPHELPAELRPLVALRFHRCNFTDEVLATFRTFTSTIPFGVYAAPRKWEPGDDSWKRAAGARLIAK